MNQKQEAQQHKPTPQLQTTAPRLARGMTLDESRIMCTAPIIPLREKIFFRLITETLLRPFEVLNLLIENWDRKQELVTAIRVKTKTKPKRGNRHAKEWLPSKPKTRAITHTTNEMLREYVGNRKKGAIFANEAGETLSLSWFKERINHYATILNIQKEKHDYIDGRKLKLITCMALREAGERHHDNTGGSRKLSAVGADHTMEVKQKNYEKVGEDFEQIVISMKKYHPAFTEGW